MDGYLAYGLKDEKFKYGGGIKFKLSDKPRQFVGLNYKFDVQQLGQSDNGFTDDNLLFSLFRRNPATKLNTIEIQKAWYEMEWFPGFSNRITFAHNRFRPLGDLDVSYYTNDEHTDYKNSFETSEISFDSLTAKNLLPGKLIA
jgi:hypothetical protein